MTVASSQTNEFSIDRICLTAYRLASLMGPEEPAEGIQWEQRASFGRDLLELIVKELEGKGRLIRARRFLTLDLVAGQAEYTLPDRVMDVYQKASYISASEVDIENPQTELPITQISIEQWQGLGTRSSDAVAPIYYLALRSGSAIDVKLWPIPGESGHIRFQVYEFLADSLDGAKTVDLERHWQNYLVHSLAESLAEAHGLPSDKVMRLAAKAADKLKDCLGQSKQRTGSRFVVRPGRR